MRTLTCLLGLIGVAAFLCGPSEASYLEGEPTDVRIVPPPRSPGNEITRLVQRVNVGKPYSTRNMTVFPLYVAGETDATRYATLDEALEQGWLTVYEKGAGQVQEVLVQNTSRHHVFLMAGEIISGAKQDRVIRTDALLRPHGPEVAVPVYCVERGRWAGRSMTFRSKKSSVNNALRFRAQSGAGQDAVWKGVEDFSKAVGVASDTSNFQDVVEDKNVQRALGEYDECMRVPPRRCIGAAIVINRRIAGVELFANEALFAALWPKLRSAYALDAYPVRERWENLLKIARIAHFITEHDIRVFLNGIHRTRFTRKGAVDLGFMYRIRGNDLAGEGLIFEDSVVHVNFAPERAVILPNNRVRELQRGDGSPTEGE